MIFIHVIYDFNIYIYIFTFLFIDTDIYIYTHIWEVPLEKHFWDMGTKLVFRAAKYGFNRRKC